MPATVDSPPETITTPCAACGAPMLPEQDWCLSCGTAKPGRLGRRPGGRAVGAVSGLVVLLVLAAVLVGYTALTDDANDDAGQAAGPSATPVPGQVAQVPDAPAVTTTAPAPPPVTTPGATTSTATGGTTSIPATTAVTPPAVTPPAVTPPAVTPPAVTPPPPPAATPPPPPPPAEVDTLAPIELGEDAAETYDPSERAVRAGDPAKAHDGNVRTTWSVITPDDGFPMQVGLLVDLGKAQNVKRITLGTTTPGGRVEVYSTAGKTVPPDILDARWDHVASRSDVDANAKSGNKRGDDVEKIRLPGKGTTGVRARYVLLWFTKPPADGPTVRVTEVGVEG